MIQQCHSWGYTQRNVSKVTIKEPAHMFIEALFTIAMLWKQPICLTTNEWIKKMWYFYRMEIYSATKKNEILSYVSKWVDLENVILSKVSQAQKAKNHKFPLICRLPKTNAVILLDMGHTLREEHAREE
jgi:hypothetical protein